MCPNELDYIYGKLFRSLTIKVANYIEVSTCDDRRLYFNDHHNLDDNVTFKRTRCKWGLFWVENSQHQRGVYLHNFTFYFDVHLIHFPYLLNK